MRLFFRIIISLLLTWLVLYGLNVSSAPEGEWFSGAVLNPATFVSGTMFFLSFGLGWKAWLSLVAVLLLILLLFYSIYRLVSAIAARPRYGKYK